MTTEPSVRAILSRGSAYLSKRAMLGLSTTFSPDEADRMSLSLDKLGEHIDDIRAKARSEHEELVALRRLPWRLYKTAGLLGLGWLLGHYG